MFEPKLLKRAEDLLQVMRTQKLTLATAESCTGGLIAGLFTEIAGASDVVDRGFVTYSNDAKIELIGVPAPLIDAKGAVSREVAEAMAKGAAARAKAGPAGAIAVAVTGVAGPGGGTTAKPVGLVHLAVARRDGSVLHKECRFGDIGRSAIRIATVAAALDLIAVELGF
jgi:nicotinamide-nucleotide amidase